MADLYHEFGGDLVIGNNSDLLTATGAVLASSVCCAVC